MAKPEKIATPPAAEQAEVLNDEFQGSVNTETGEVVTTTAKFVPKVLRSVTVETLKVGAGQSVYVQVLAAMEKARRAVGKATEPATLLSVLNLETGKKTQLVMPTVLRSILDEEYPDGAYVGKGFAITKSGEKKGASVDRQYFTYLVDEIEVPV